MGDGWPVLTSNEIWAYWKGSVKCRRGWASASKRIYRYPSCLILSIAFAQLKNKFVCIPDEHSHSISHFTFQRNGNEPNLGSQNPSHSIYLTAVPTWPYRCPQAVREAKREGYPAKKILRQNNPYSTLLNNISTPLIATEYSQEDKAEHAFQP